MRTKPSLAWILFALLLCCVHVAANASRDDDKLTESDIAGVALDAEQEQQLRDKSDTFEFEVPCLCFCHHKHAPMYACIP